MIKKIQSPSLQQWNVFGHLWWSKTYRHHLGGNIEFFFNHRTFMDLGRLIDSGLISTIDFVNFFDLETKFDMPCNKM